MEKLCVIFGAGERFAPRRKITPNDLVIAADGGYEFAMSLGIEPNVVIGDFDSCAVPQNTAAHVVKLNRDKDDTDMMAAVKLGLRREYRTFVIYGGTGGRLDHTAANFAALAYLNAYGAHGYLIDGTGIVTVITDEKFTLPKNSSGTVSVFAYGGAASGVTLEKLKFGLKDYELMPDCPIGVSNETTGIGASVSVKHGSLLIFFPRP